MDITKNSENLDFRFSTNLTSFLQIPLLYSKNDIFLGGKPRLTYIKKRDVLFDSVYHSISMSVEELSKEMSNYNIPSIEDEKIVHLEALYSKFEQILSKELLPDGKKILDHLFESNQRNNTSLSKSISQIVDVLIPNISEMSKNFNEIVVDKRNLWTEMYYLFLAQILKYGMSIYWFINYLMRNVNEKRHEEKIRKEEEKYRE
jgi:hypothetical protein